MARFRFGMVPGGSDCAEGIVDVSGKHQACGLQHAPHRQQSRLDKFPAHI